MSATTSPAPPLSQGVGYGVVIGLGVAFAIGMVLTTRALKKAFGEDSHTTETFMVANRSVGTGLTASAVISSWTFTSALLGAPYLTYWYGIALPIWWANGQSVMICCFAYLAIQAKLKAPNAHTLLELIRVRYGLAAHILWIVMALLNNIFNFTSMLVGASTAVSALTGINVYAATYLLPLGVVVYTYWGGLRATFLTDYIHTFIIMIVLVWFSLKVIVASEIGSIGALYDLIKALPQEGTISGNHAGSYLSMTSDESLFFGIIHIVTNFGIVFMDTGFWQKGFSADVAAAVPGYIIGGNAYFAIPFTFGTVVGLGALVLEQTPTWPTYPRRMTQAEVSGGLVLPYTASAVAGKGGAVAILLILFMACTSVASAQLIAVSSIVSFDIYGGYFKKKPTDRELIRWSHVGVVGCALFISTFATVLHKGGVDLNWLIYMIGIVICPGTFPTCFALLWKKQSKTAAIVSPIVGMAAGFAVWFGTAHALYGEITITTTGKTLPCMYACLTSMFVPLPVSVAISFLKPSHFDWDEFLKIERVSDKEGTGAGTGTGTSFDREAYFSPERVKYMKRMSRNAAIWAAATFLGQIVLWPLPMYGAKKVMSKGLFIAWLVVRLIWLFITLLIANFYPLVDGGLQQIWQVIRRGIKKSQREDSESSESSVIEVDARSRDELPSAATLTKVAKHTVLDREGKELRFEDLYAGPNASQRTLVVFVRHFYCGSCQEYLRSMVEVITPDYLSHLPVTTSVAIIGCGSPSLIDHYAAEVGGCPYPLYCDPTLKLYDDLGMYTTWDLGPHPAYIRKSMVRVVLESFWQIFRLLPAGLALSGGPKSQVGGEFLFELSGDGEEKRISWCHRMNTSRDHTEIPIIADILDGGSTHDEPKAVTQ
ncbi:Sodium:solute symporter family-domain-containing protein [Aspergillus cavernicola]|uniref:Sodium:solute symporter family-domain-containing protein n=1 Tax=Aspergillus cavernicola TaxID=176166 RepID=A0ABR4HMF4_9EURO